MNILFLISSLKYGGAEKQAVIDSNLLSNNHNVFLVTFKDGPLKEILDTRINYSILKKTSYIRTAKLLAKMCKINGIEIIHASLFAASIISAISTFFCKTNVIWHFHSHEYDIPFYSKFAFVLLARLEMVKKIYFVNNELKKYLQHRFYLPKNKLGILYNSTSFKNQLSTNTKKGKLIIGYVGRLIELKRVYYLIELTDFLLQGKNIEFEVWIIGDGEEMKALQESINNKKLNNFIKLFGFQRDIRHFYENFDIFILPSREECLSIALIDSGFAGVPAMAFDVGGNGEIINNGITGFIVQSKEDLFEKTILLLKNHDLRKSFSKNAMMHCTANFSMEVRSRNLIKISSYVVKSSAK